GHGGMSAVFRARQPRLDRMVALKVLPKSLAATPGFAERFTREGRVLARLSHPNIVTVHDFGESGGFCFLIMEYVDGVNLRQAMRAGRFTPEQALNIIPVMCEALQYAHSQGVLHRDIKPENILLDTKGRVKIADFGIAKILDENGDGGMMLTQSGAKLGTAPYMAPEQIEKPGSVDHRADIYSLGVVFYEMLTGELPLGRFAAPSEKSAVNGNMDEVVFRALAKDRAMRQQSAGEFKTQIEGIASMPPQARRSLAMRFSSFEYKSKRTLLGRPLLHITSGIDPTTGHKRIARGFFAFGDRAVGVVAFGGYARGLFACGGMAVGVFALGGMSIGLISWGGLALALLLAYGGLSVGFLSAGGLAVGWEAAGGLAAGVHAYGGQVFALVSGIGGQVHAPHVFRNLTEAPPLLLWLVRATNESGFLATWIWLPMMLPSVLMPWWARRQLEFEAQGGAQRTTAWHERPSRVLWLIPAVVPLFLSLSWMTRHWVHASQTGVTAQTLVASGIEIIGSILALLSLPLWLRLVPMNSFYGVRLPSTFVSDERWYDVNAVFGKHLYGWSLTVVAAGIAGIYQLPRHQDAYSWAAITLTLVAVAASVVSTLVWMHRHPVGRPAIKPHRLVRNLELVIPVVVLMLFVRSFIARPYFIPSGNEPGVAKNSRWIASHLDTGFAQGDLIAYAHENGQTWLARVVAVESKGLLLKRGGNPEEYLMSWDKIIGKMLFPYYSPAGSKASLPASGAAPVSAPAVAQLNKGFPPAETTSHALQQEPRLLFLRMVPNDQPWALDVHDAQGRPYVATKDEQKIIRNSTTGQTCPDAETCWLQAWIQHPDLDEASHVTVMAIDATGRPDKNQGIVHWNDYTTGDRPTGGHVHSVVLRAGEWGHLPRTVELSFAYSAGPWDSVKRVDKNPGTNISTDDWIKGGVGEDAAQHCFVTWLRRREDRQVQCVAYLKDGSKFIGMNTSTKSGRDISERAVFDMRLDEVDYFELQARDIRKVAFKDVVLPPLQKAEVMVEAPARSGLVTWHKGLTLGVVLDWAGWSPVMAANGMPKPVRLIHDGYNEDIQVNEQTRGMQINPGGKIIVPQ
ncbi:MAG: protein kinase, partial [Prosthecobacter sp.]|uniref:serine/threonine-protein kinase n=1 Tax=Prosthecobacter sp. TaxID=1965333 RepID=UPI003BAEFDDC